MCLQTLFIYTEFTIPSKKKIKKIRKHFRAAPGMCILREIKYSDAYRYSF